MGLGADDAVTGKFSDSHPHLYLETVFPALKVTQNYHLHCKINIFFLKTGNLITN